ncbi:MAG: aminoglycoside 6-adenylyltransferase [Chloroflexi bacterium]|nr:aminoglycoside 6-adenylyltransferase [Chloroflexota bacterium]
MKQYEDKVTAWGIVRPKIRTILVTGSQARQDRPADQWSDLDIDIYVTEFDDYFASGTFADEFGTVWLKQLHQTNDGDPLFWVLYEGGAKVDFTFFPLDFLREQVEKQALMESQQRGYRVLIDKDNLAKFLPPQIFSKPTFEKPSAEEFMSTVNYFWHNAVAVAKQIRRRNMWVVKTTNWQLTGHLFQMIEWQSQVISRKDTWYGGNFLREWTDDETWRALHKVFAHFDPVESWQSLFGAMILFRRIASETAKYLGFEYPTTLDGTITTYIQKLFDDEKTGGEKDRPEFKSQRR